MRIRFLKEFIGFFCVFKKSVSVVINFLSLFFDISISLVKVYPGEVFVCSP